MPWALTALLAACQGRAPTAADAQGPAAPAFAPLDDARRAALTAQANALLETLWAGRCDAWLSAIQAPFGYGRRDLHFRDRLGVSLLSEGQARIYCQDLAALKQPQPTLTLEAADHIPSGQWEAREFKTVAPHGLDRLTFALSGKPEEALELYFNADSRVVALVEVARPVPKPPQPPPPPSP